ncbi:hypothetical protein E8E13_009494 [Curvularia kusanoi]|uniref:Nucleoside 2-deoxyribosyltransferase like protein n=1 Tax=Curvularia kusanoi TaxID=90978 RepID=A0A9P4TJ41_CURKU|nr:hypothetical protein E8E13_009494 [Curvularia kusanoi]
MCFGLRKSNTSPQSVNRARAQQGVEPLATSNNSLVQPDQQKSSRDFTSSERKTANLDNSLAMTSKRQSDQDNYSEGNRKHDDAGESEVKPAKMARKEEAAKPAPIDVDAIIEDKSNQLPKEPPPTKAHPLFVHCNPPDTPTYRDHSIFLAGSIEMGKAIQWQKEMVKWLSPLAITVNNPRRGKWDPAATQEAKNEGFRAQVLWELAALEKADVICFFFDADTISPVTMMELGLWVGKQPDKVVVCCNKAFWRAGNIHLVCERYNVPCVETFKELVVLIKDTLQQKAEVKGKPLEVMEQPSEGTDGVSKLEAEDKKITLDEIKSDNVAEGHSRPVVPISSDTPMQNAAGKGTKLDNIEDSHLAE